METISMTAETPPSGLCRPCHPDDIYSRHEFMLMVTVSHCQLCHLQFMGQGLARLHEELVHRGESVCKPRNEYFTDANKWQYVYRWTAALVAQTALELVQTEGPGSILAQVTYDKLFRLELAARATRSRVELLLEAVKQRAALLRLAAELSCRPVVVNRNVKIDDHFIRGMLWDVTSRESEAVSALQEEDATALLSLSSLSQA
ncbi:hypothetical protein PsYK624_125770 [Phanerochaete sordida]|uniref:C2H2-type domain-containing protein n=1 Tax=Phanerochaete sordida TaxID=48140 RepID=A0A9P3GJZ5_9APHY|nr:hypothetical protein PsYK624_125770 [Phanerochaete sordida]